MKCSLGVSLGKAVRIVYYRQNHDRDVTTAGAAMSHHDISLPEISC